MKIHANALNNDLYLFSFGISFDKTGQLTIDDDELAAAVSADSGALERMMVGVAENEGLGTQLKEQLDNLNYTSGLMTAYLTGMETRKESLSDSYEKAVEDLDSKYDAMAAQFVAYASIITQMESSFSSLKMMIDTESSS